MRMRTRSPFWMIIGAVPGYDFPFSVSILKSVISTGFGRDVPGSMRHSLSI